MTARDLPAHKARVYFEKARRFASTADAAARRGDWDPAVSSAVHAGINAADALCIRCLSKRAAPDAHDDAVDLLFSIESIPRSELAAVVKHFKALLSLKHRAEYEDRLCDGDEARRALDAMQRMMSRIGDWLE